MTEIDSTHSYNSLSQQFHIVDAASQQSENVAAPRPQFGVLAAWQSFLDCNPMLILRRQNWRVVSSAICKVLSWRWARDLPLWPDRSISASKPTHLSAHEGTAAPRDRAAKTNLFGTEEQITNTEKDKRK